MRQSNYPGLKPKPKEEPRASDQIGKLQDRIGSFKKIVRFCEDHPNIAKTVGFAVVGFSLLSYLANRKD